MPTSSTEQFVTELPVQCEQVGEDPKRGNRHRGLKGRERGRAARWGSRGMRERSRWRKDVTKDSCGKQRDWKSPREERDGEQMRGKVTKAVSQTSPLKIASPFPSQLSRIEMQPFLR